MNPARTAQTNRGEASGLFDVDNYLEDLSALARAETSPDRFYGQVLESSTLALGADGAGYWRFQTGRPPQLLRRHKLAGSFATERRTLERLREAYASGVPRLLRPAKRSQEGWVLACPVRGALGLVGLITHHLPASVGEPLAERLLDLAAAVAEVADDFELRRQVAEVGQSLRRVAKLENLLLRLHAAADPNVVARIASTEGRALVGCDRITTVSLLQGAPRVAAITGVANPSRRSDVVRNVQRLARVVARGGETVHLRDGDRDLPPQIDRVLDRYLSGSEVRELIIAPCKPLVADEDCPAPAPVAVLVAEWFQGTADSHDQAALAALCDHTAVALVQTSRLGRRWLPTWFSGTASGQRRPLLRAFGWSLAATVLVGLLALAAVQPIELKIPCEGRLVAQQRGRVFAPRDARVEAVLVKHGQRVKKGELLVQLVSAELDLDIKRVEAELAAAVQEMASLETAKLRAGLPGQARQDDADPATLSSRIEALKAVFATHQAKLALLRAEGGRLRVLSPLAGQVLSWRPGDDLSGRPVRRGQQLLEVADTSGGWELELEVPDRRAAHVISAGAGATVSFVAKSDPSRSFRGEVQRLSDATLPNDQGEAGLAVTVHPESLEGLNPRSGMMVAAKVHCGPEPLGYVWLHEAWEALQRAWF